MIVVGIALQTIIAGLIALPILLGLQALGLEARWVGVATWAFVFVLLNVLGFVDYYRFRQSNKAGAFHMIPRAIQRIRTGREFDGIVVDETGTPVDPQAPIRAGARLAAGLAVIIVAAAAFVFGLTSRGDGALVVMGCGMIAFPVGILITLQALLAYAGAIRRVR
jgi:hypothetical protein